MSIPGARARAQLADHLGQAMDRLWSKYQIDKRRART